MNKFAINTNTSEIGLCLDCEYARHVEAKENSVYFLCERSLTDPTFPKYPRLPVRQCLGYVKDSRGTFATDPPRRLKLITGAPVSWQFGESQLIRLKTQLASVELVFGEAFTIKDVAVDQPASVQPNSGSVTIGGTITCNAPGDALIHVDLTQRINSKLVAEGVETLFPSCSSAGTAWSGAVVPFFGPQSGPFKPGLATITVTAEACGTPSGSVFTCDSKVVTQKILLLPGK